MCYPLLAAATTGVVLLPLAGVPPPPGLVLASTSHSTVTLAVHTLVPAAAVTSAFITASLVMDICTPFVLLTDLTNGQHRGD